MAQGRGSAITRGTRIGLALLSLLLVMGDVAMATEYKVGDCHGWTFNVQDWANGKHFKAGDVLVFKYPVGQHNVMRVDKLNYDNCFGPMSGNSYNTGEDKIMLVKGPNYFICGFPGHCMMGMKVAINVE